MVFVSRLISAVFLTCLCFSRARECHVLAPALRLSRVCFASLVYVAQQRRSRSASCNAAALEFWCEDNDVLACMSGTPHVTSWPSKRVRGSCLASESLQLPCK